MSIKMSCICIVYGRHQYLGEVVQCFLDQTYDNKELILVNTCPRQTFIYDHPLVKVYNLSERPKNHCQAMHEGVIRSTGDWVIPFDDDDVFLPKFLEQYVKHIENNPTHNWIQLYGRYYGTVDSVIDYKPNDTYCHLFAYSRNTYDTVGGYIAPGGLYDADICDQNLFKALGTKTGGRCYTIDYDSSMVYRWGGISYHHSSQSESNEESKYDVIGRKINELLDSGKLPIGVITIIPGLKNDWLKMCKEKYDVGINMLSKKTIDIPIDILKSIEESSWEQYINPNTDGDETWGGQFTCVKVFDKGGKTRDNHDYTVKDGVIRFDNHELRYDNYGQLIGYNSRFKVKLLYKRVKYTTKDSVIVDVTAAKRINYFVQVFKHPNPIRQLELDYCLMVNKKNPYINVIEITKQDRMMFKEFIDYIKPYESNNTINLFGNSDIILDDSIIYTLKLSSKQAISLSRYDGVELKGLGLDSSKSYRVDNPRYVSADVWGFRGKIKDIPEISFGLGIWGCDGAFTERLMRAGYEVINPSKSIKTWHIHGSNIRTNQFPEAPKPWGKLEGCSLPWESELEDLKRGYELELKRPIIILASLPRSGTTNMCHMADRCGFKSAHVCFNYKAALSKGYNFFADTPFYNAEFLHGILQYTHNVKVIYINRDIERVKESWNRNGLDKYLQGAKYNNTKTITDLIDISCWRGLQSDKDLSNHKDKIRSLCKHMGVPFLEYSFKDGWEPFCKYLEVNTITGEVPHFKNKLI